MLDATLPKVGVAVGEDRSGGIEDTATALLSDSEVLAAGSKPGISVGDEAPSDEERRAARLIKLKWTGVLGVIFLVNYVQTAFESCCKRQSTVDLGFDIATALHQIEWQFQFVNHDLSNPVAVYGYSVSYFFLLPILVWHFQRCSSPGFCAGAVRATQRIIISNPP